MFTDLAAYAFAALASIAPPLVLAPEAPYARAWDIARSYILAPDKAEASYKTDERAVTNWRTEAAVHLDLDPSIAKAFAEGGDPRSVGRCVKLNNYWCIKGTGWNGMLAADAEGHAAFSSAPEGAAVAALLLRRYYLDFSRRSAQAIVSRWAPAQCGGVIASLPRSRVHTTQLGAAFRGMGQNARRSLGPAPAARPAPLATRGLGNTLRARYLASKRQVKTRFGKNDWPGARRSVIPDRTPPMLRTPIIATGFGSIEAALAPKSTISLISFAARATPTSLPPLMSCAGDSVRIRNYAMKVIEGVTASPDDDLKLFEPDGTPNANLAIVMANMASVEIGPLKALPALVRSGIDTATAAVRLAAQNNAARAAAASEKAATN